jgi:iron complex outermembrane receptor protein
MKVLVAALLVVCCAGSALAEASHDDENNAKPRTERKRREDKPQPRVERRATQSEEDAKAAGSGTSPRAQALGRDQSGVYVNAAVANSGYSPSFVMRGFPSKLTLFDGASRGFSEQDVDLSTVDHVEFYKGPSAMLFGRALGGYGGAANYIRKSPTDETFAHLVATVGTFNVGRITLDANAPLNDDRNLLFRLTGSAQNVGSFVDFVRSRSFDVAPMIAFTADNGDRWTLRAEHNAGRLVWRDGVPADPIFFHVAREFYAGASANEHETPRFDDFTATYEHAFSKDWRIAAVVDYFLDAGHYGWFKDWGYDGRRSIVFGQPVRTRYATRSFDAQLRLNGRFETGPFEHNVFLGLEHWDYYNAHAETIARDALAPIDIFRPVYPSGINYLGAYWANGVARAWTQSVYGQDLIDLSPHWRLLVGGRYDLLAQREILLDPLGALSGEATYSVSKGLNGYVSPRAGILFQPWDDTLLFAAFGRSLIPNTGVRLRSATAPPPQQDTQYEIGVRRDFLDHKMTFEVGLFDVTRDNVAIRDPSNPSGFYSLVTGQQHSHGIEVNVGGEVLPNLKVNAVATFLHAVVSKDSNTPSQQGGDLLGAPRRVYNVSANYTFDSGDWKGLELGVSYHYASRAEATLPNTYGFTLPPQQMLGAALAYSFDDRTKLEINATNLTNRSNWTSNGAMFYGEPRSVSASLSYKY